MRKSLKYLLEIILSIFLLLTDMSAQDPICIVNYFGTIEVTPDIVLDGAGQNIDSIEFWKAPDITESLMFVTAKDNSLVEVWKYPFNIDDELTPLTHSSFGTNAFVNGVQVDQEADLLFISISSPENTVSVFTLPDLQFQIGFNSNSANYFSEPNLAMIKLTNGEKQLFVTADTSVHIHDITDIISPNFGNYISFFTLPMEIETMQADDYHQNIMIPDENNLTGVYAYYPDGSPYPTAGQNNFGNGMFQADAEGILLYNCSSTGGGFFVVADQIISQSEFEFFDRIAWTHFGTMKITSVNNTDGIASFPYSSPDYPRGLFAAIDNDNKTVLVNWDKIFSEIENNGGLPVELSSFTAESIDGQVLLKWITQTETNNFGFEIEKKVNENKWTKIEFVKGNGNSTSPKVYRFIDEKPFGGSKFKYRLKQIDTDGKYEYSDELEIQIVPNVFALYQNYPNPFNPTTTIRYQLPKESKVIIKIYDILGAEVITLLNDKKKPGVYEVELNVQSLSSGTYIYRIIAGEFVETKRMVLLR